jgi:thiosulfate/3-mercaptopyruvate sulfurtransferase
LSYAAPMCSPLVSAGALDGAFLVDARSGPDGAAAYADAHLVGAVRVGLNEDLSGDASNPSVGGRHPLPSLTAWAATLGRLGIGPDTNVVVYDDKGGANAAARFWWMLRALGHQQVRVLNGGWAAALAQGLPTEQRGTSPTAKGPYPAPDEWLLKTVDRELVLARAEDPTWKLLDVRSGPRHRGEEEKLDPIAGHIPGAQNVFFGDNLTPEGLFLSADELAERYQAFLGEVSPTQLIVSCGSGVTACHTLLALDAAGLHGARLYVGSWSEWCRSNRPKNP